MGKKLSDFQPQRQNANKHNPRGMGMLDNAIAKNGWITAITTAADGEAIDGSARLETAYTRFGEEVEPIVVRSKGDRPIIHIREDIPSADDPRAKELSVAANRIAEANLDWDVEVLEEWSQEVDLSGLWSGRELEILVNENPVPDEDPGEGDRGGIDGDKYVIPLVLDWKEKQRWDERKERVSIKVDKKFIWDLLDRTE